MQEEASRVMILPMPRVCPERMALVDSFIKAVSHYNQLQAAQIAALVRGEGFQFGKEMRSAQREVGLRRRAILGHEREHGCDV